MQELTMLGYDKSRDIEKTVSCVLKLAINNDPHKENSTMIASDFGSLGKTYIK